MIYSRSPPLLQTLSSHIFIFSAEQTNFIPAGYYNWLSYYLIEEKETCASSKDSEASDLWVPLFWLLFGQGVRVTSCLNIDASLKLSACQCKALLLTTVVSFPIVGSSLVAWLCFQIYSLRLVLWFLLKSVSQINCFSIGSSWLKNMVLNGLK